MSGQIVDASLVPAPKQRNTDLEKKAVKAGKSAAEIWPDKPNKAGQKDVDARWTLPAGLCPLDSEGRRQGPLPIRRHAHADDRNADFRL